MKSLLDTVEPKLTKVAAQDLLEKRRAELEAALADHPKNFTLQKRIMRDIARCRAILGPPQWLGA